LFFTSAQSAQALWGDPDHKRRFSVLSRFLVCGIIVGLLVWVSTWAEANKPASHASVQRLEQAAGIQIKSLRLSAAGNLIDLRYKVTDPEKATTFFEEKRNQPYLIDLATGVRLSIPETKIGALRTSPKNMVADKVNFMMFANPGAFLKRGSKVTVVIGVFKAENLIVE